MSSLLFISLFLLPSSHQASNTVISHSASQFPASVRQPMAISTAANMTEQIPKPNKDEGLTIGWPQQQTDMEKLKALSEEIKSRM